MGGTDVLMNSELYEGIGFGKRICWDEERKFPISKKSWMRRTLE